MLTFYESIILLNFGHWNLPFGLAQGGGESFDFAQDREPVERLVEPFGICVLLFGIYYLRHLKPVGWAVPTGLLIQQSKLEE